MVKWRISWIQVASTLVWNWNCYALNPTDSLRRLIPRSFQFLKAIWKLSLPSVGSAFKVVCKSQSLSEAHYPLAPTAFVLSTHSTHLSWKISMPLSKIIRARIPFPPFTPTPFINKALQATSAVVAIHNPLFRSTHRIKARSALYSSTALATDSMTCFLMRQLSLHWTPIIA